MCTVSVSLPHTSNYENWQRQNSISRVFFNGNGASKGNRFPLRLYNIFENKSPYYPTICHRFFIIFFDALTRWKEFNETWQKARSQRPLPNLRFSGRSEKEDGRPGLWLAETFSTSPQKPLKGIQRNLTESKISTSSTKFAFFGLTGKTRWPPWPLIGWDIFDFSSETAERNSTKLNRK